VRAKEPLVDITNDPRGNHHQKRAHGRHHRAKRRRQKAAAAARAETASRNLPAGYLVRGTVQLIGEHETHVLLPSGQRATLLSNHGVLAVGDSLRAAYAVAIEVENLATQYLALLAAGLEPRLLDDAELARVIEKFADYGRLARD